VVTLCAGRKQILLRSDQWNSWNKYYTLLKFKQPYCFNKNSWHRWFSPIRTP